jgi:hypothetical protein
VSIEDEEISEVSVEREEIIFRFIPNRRLLIGSEFSKPARSGEIMPNVPPIPLELYFLG